MISFENFFSDSSSEDEEQLRVNRRLIRDKSNPLGLPSELFIKLFRLSKDAFVYLMDTLGPELKCASRSSAVPPVIKIAAALRFFSEGSYQKGCGQDFNIGLAQSSVSTALSEVLCAMSEKICPFWISFQQSEHEKQKCKLRFLQKSGIPGVIGCVDGTHISIVAPKDNEHHYLNRKGYHSLNAMIVCDDEMKIKCIEARYGGASHDSFIWRLSDQRTYLEQQRSRDPNSWLLGDSGYPLEPWLITPYKTAIAGSREAAFNQIHSKARNIVERSIGLLKSRFRCLLKARQLYYTPEKAVQIINACCALHNICIQYNVDLPEISEDVEEGEINEENIAENHSAANIRDRILNSIL